MKKNKLFSALAVLATASIFVGCYNGTDLTKTWDKAESYNDKAVENFKAPTTCEFSVNSSDFKANRKDNEAKIEFTSDFYLDESTLNAVSFFGITESENNYPTETALTSSVKTVTKAEDSGKVKTTVTYNVDLTSYNKKYIGAKIDATVLKDVNKNFVLNGNGNEKAGEATDSTYVRLFTVKNNKNNDPFTETLTVTTTAELKPFAPTIFAYTSIAIKTISDTQYIAIDGWYEDYAANTLNSTSATQLSSIFKLQTILPGTSKWVDTSVQFTWDGSQYIAPVVMALAPAGTKYRVVATSDPSVTFKAAGMDVPLTYTSTKLYGELTSGVSSYYAKDTTTIVTITKMTNFVTDGAPDSVQKSFASVTTTALTLAGYGAKFEINFNFSDLQTETDKIGLASTDDFIVTTKGEYGYKKVPATVEAVKNDDGIITKVIVKTEENKKANYLASDLLVWAGSGVTITRNDKNAAQTHFGTALDFVKRDASGYVQLN